MELIGGHSANSDGHTHEIESKSQHSLSLSSGFEELIPSDLLQYAGQFLSRWLLFQ